MVLFRTYKKTVTTGLSYYSLTITWTPPPLPSPLLSNTHPLVTPYQSPLPQVLTNLLPYLSLQCLHGTHL